MNATSGADVLFARLIGLNQSGHFARTVEESERALRKYPQDARFHLVRAEALNSLENWTEAAEQYERAAALGEPDAAMAWRFAGLMRQREKMPAAAFHAYQRAVELNPADWEVMANLLRLCGNHYTSRPEIGLSAALRLFAQPNEKALNYVCAAQVFKAVQWYALALEAYEKALQADPGMYYAQAARLEIEQFACLWDRVETHTTALMREVYAVNDDVPPIEKNLMHVAWCMDEAVNLKLARAALKERLSETILRTEPFDHARHRWEGRLRVGYVSWDFYDHATLHLIGGVLARHNRAEIEVFAYDHSPADNSLFRKRFENSVEHIVDIRGMSDIEAAERIYADGIDVLVDLKGNTQSARLGIFAMKPAPVQVTWLGFPGSSGMAEMDYVLSDAVVTPDSSAAFYPEKLCRMPESYQSNDYERAVAEYAGTRADWGLPEQGIVFCSFNQSYKMDRPTFEAWLDVLSNVPDSVLWLLDPGAEAQQQLNETAALFGIDPSRLVYSPKVPIPLHMARLSLADLCLDTRVYNGHTTTSDALWMGVPVVTAAGTHFPSRVSASLLKACDMPELIAADMAGMAKLAIELANNPTQLSAVRDKLRRNRFISPLYDTERFTRHLERAFQLMADRARQNLPPALIDVPALPRRTEPFVDTISTLQTTLKAADFVSTEPASQQRVHKQLQAQLQWSQPQCPLCHHAEITAVAPVTWSQPVGSITKGYWALCGGCGHLYARNYWSAEGKTALQTAFMAQPPVAAKEAKDITTQRPFMHDVVSAAVDALDGLTLFLQRSEPARWVDVYGASLAQIAAVQEWGFAPSVLARHADDLQVLAELGVQAAAADFLSVNFEGRADVVSLLGVLEQEAFPDLLLARAFNLLAPGGVLVVSFDNAANAQWRRVERAQSGALWQDPKRLHWFVLVHMKRLLQERGFSINRMFPDPASDFGMVMIAKKVIAKGNKV